jgi:hypothetical protein
MELLEGLVAHLAQTLCGTTELTYGGRPLDLTPPWRRATMFELVEEHAGAHVDLETPIDELRRIAAEHRVPIEAAWGPGKLILEIYEKTTEARIVGPTFVCDYPREVSPFARPHREDRDLTERFELIVGGRELARKVLDTGARNFAEEPPIELLAMLDSLVALQAWDGGAGETGTKMSLTSWYYLRLEEPQSSRKFIIPPVVALLTLAAMILVVRAANRTR